MGKKSNNTEIEFLIGEINEIERAIELNQKAIIHGKFLLNIFKLRLDKLGYKDAK